MQGTSTLTPARCSDTKLVSYKIKPESKGTYEEQNVKVTKIQQKKKENFNKSDVG